MSKNKIVLIIGVIFFFMPFLGFPPAWKSFFSIIFGLLLIVLTVWSSIRARLGLPSFEKKNKDTSEFLSIDADGASFDQARIEPKNRDSMI